MPDMTLEQHRTGLDDGTDRARWLAIRRGLITATQAAAIAGSHPYTKLIDVWNQHTDPDHDPDVDRNQWLDERAANGTEREPEILAWASKRPWARKRWTPSTALVGHPEHPKHAATPDAWAFVGDVLELAEAKTTSQDWHGVDLDAGGTWAAATATDLPQHIVDQCLWQLYVTGAARVRVYVERTEWSGRGKSRTATVVGREVHVVESDPARLAVILDEVARFEWHLAEGIAPESDLRIDDLLDLDPFAASEDDLATAAQLARLDELLTEVADLDDAIAVQVKRRGDAEAEAKRIVKGLDYVGRRVHLIGTRRIVKLTRFLKSSLNASAIPADVARAATEWKRIERVAIEANPEYVHPIPEADPASTI